MEGESRDGIGWMLTVPMLSVPCSIFRKIACRPSFYFWRFNRNCPAGTYAGALTGINCAAGKHSAAEGASSAATCVDCGAGTYSNTTGRSACQLCAGGKYSLPCKASTYPVGVQTSYSTSQFSGLSCTACYNQPYSERTDQHHIETCKSAEGPGSWIAMGSKSNSRATSFDVLAFIPASGLVPSESTSQ